MMKSRWSCLMRCLLTPEDPPYQPVQPDQVSPASGSYRHTLIQVQVSPGSLSGVLCVDSYRYHFLDSLGRPRTVLCHTMGKLVLLAKF